MTLDGEIERVRMMDRQTLVANKNREQTDNTSFKILLDYNVQHKKFEKNVLKNWSILKQDRVLGAVLPTQLQFIYI